MRIVNAGGRLALELSDGIVDVATASNGSFGPDVQEVYDQWSEFVEWAKGQTELTGPHPAQEDLGAPAPRPRQIFAIGLNYKDHADETGSAYPDSPLVFTKFQTSIAAPFGSLVLPSGDVDWEVEMVVIIGTGGANIAEADAWSRVAGLTVGQDYSERAIQLAGTPPQFSMGKSFPGFSPLGPRLVTIDEFENVDDLALSCDIDGEIVQDGRTNHLLFNVPQLIAWLSSITPLTPGDLIFTGTPAGVGMARNPRRFLEPGEVVTSTIEGIGSIAQRCVSA
ncbi:MAG: fumarylacetoacetate hydrolase family protein [Acidimicrobiales bacterium]